MTVYFCRSRVISKQQANYSGCIPRKKSVLNCFAHSLLALNYHKLRARCTVGLEKNKPPAWGLSLPDFCASTAMMAFTALLAHSASRCTKFGNSQPRSAIASRALLNICDPWQLWTGGLKAASLPQLEF